jgi:hypothetical protein
VASLIPHSPTGTTTMDFSIDGYPLNANGLIGEIVGLDGPDCGYYRHRLVPSLPPTSSPTPHPSLPSSSLQSLPLTSWPTQLPKVQPSPLPSTPPSPGHTVVTANDPAHRAAVVVLIEVPSPLSVVAPNVKRIREDGILDDRLSSTTPPVPSPSVTSCTSWPVPSLLYPESTTFSSTGGALSVVFADGDTVRGGYGGNSFDCDEVIDFRNANYASYTWTSDYSTHSPRH